MRPAPIQTTTFGGFHRRDYAMLLCIISALVIFAITFAFIAVGNQEERHEKWRADCVAIGGTVEPMGEWELCLLDGEVVDRW